MRDDFIRFQPQLFNNAIYDDSVAVCQFCGCALKPSMTLYGEVVELPLEQQKEIFNGVNSLLIIGTSLNVEPVSLLPSQVNDNTTIHIISKEIDFNRYLKDASDSVTNYKALIENRYSHIHYNKYQGSEHKRDSGREAKEQLMKILCGTDRDANLQINAVINHVTPLFNYHMGECDVLVERLLEQLPDYKRAVGQLRQKVLQTSKRTRLKPNYNLDLENMVINYKYTPAPTAAEYELVLLAVPQLWMPDAAIYYVDEVSCYAVVCLMLKSQIQLVNKLFAGVLRQRAGLVIDGKSYRVIYDQRYADMESVDKAIYLPLGGHWSTYCIAYNYYYFADQDEGEGRYQEEYDPWSRNFMGFQRKEIYYEPPNSDGSFVYQGVWRNFHWMMDHSPKPLLVGMKQC